MFNIFYHELKDKKETRFYYYIYMIICVFIFLFPVEIFSTKLVFFPEKDFVLTFFTSSLLIPNKTR